MARHDAEQQRGIPHRARDRAHVREGGAAETGNTGTRANCPLMPKRPQSAEGMRTEPPPSVQTAKGVSPAATLAAPPPLEPPDVFARFHGLRVIPVSGLSQTALQPNSLVVDLPTMQPPAALTRSTAGASKSTTLSAKGPGAEGPGHARHRHQVLDRGGEAGDGAAFALRDCTLRFACGFQRDPPACG